MLTDYRTVNETIELATITLLNLEDEAYPFVDATALCTPDMLQGYWQCH